MLSKNKIKHILSLQRKKVRRDTGLFVIEGEKMVGELLVQRPDLVDSIYGLPDWIAAHKVFRPDHKIVLEEISDKELKQISSLQTPNQVLAIARQPKAPDLPLRFDQQLSLYLDGIQDPGNMGTILRIADWFGIQTVICSDACVEVYSPKVVQASMGAVFRVVTVTESLISLTTRFPDIPVYGTLLEGKNLYQTNLGSSGIIVIGNEGNGISEKNRTLITSPLYIPRAKDSQAESLNAAIATGIVCAFFCKSNY